MKPFSRLVSHAVAIELANCDTDQIVPARFLSRKRSEGFGEQLFHDLRYRDGHEQPDFPLNRPGADGAEILLTGPNFGCGSSRESAVWALLDSGFRAVIGESFGDIFFGNAFKNGLLPIVASHDAMVRLVALANDSSPARFEVDLDGQVVRHAGVDLLHFDIDPLRKRLLTSGLDEIAFTLTHAVELAAFEQRYDANHRWLA